ncbi:hypothetical protein DPEC_G00226690 [Dallia pectoralis]|uniref:Uncharacterized protein n=1 Tax=Dallia pectoralis TaxID=75939 RepID=A0ACC2G135_DALPE|nr:hypothetical protein DPEC_G00226690 [Dallia pectoralis]
MQFEVALNSEHGFHYTTQFLSQRTGEVGRDVNGKWGRGKVRPGAWCAREGRKAVRREEVTVKCAPRQSATPVAETLDVLTFIKPHSRNTSRESTSPAVAIFKT